MNLRTTALDCLYINWAVPRASAPPLPSPLRFETHQRDDQEFVFVSVLLFQLSDLRLESFPAVKLSYPQMNVRVYVFDGEGLPAVLFLKIIVPYWVVPISRLMARQPATGARFSYPPPSGKRLADEWRWKLRSGAGFEVVARAGAPAISHGPSLGSWTTTVEHFRNRPRGYVLWENELRAVRTSQPSVEVCPLQVDLLEIGLLRAIARGSDARVWQCPHSAWLCPRVSFGFSLGPPIRLPQTSPEVATPRPC